MRFQAASALSVLALITTSIHGAERAAAAAPVLPASAGDTALASAASAADTAPVSLASVADTPTASPASVADTPTASLASVADAPTASLASVADAATESPGSAADAASVPATSVATPVGPAAAVDRPPGAPSKPAGCLPSGNGFLRARIRGALNLDVNWRNAELECEGAARPDGSGIRLSFAGPIHSDGRRMRMVFGVTDAAEGNAGNALPTNLTVIFEGEKRLFSTRGDDRCTVDKLNQERVGALGGPTRSYRVVARGFCIEPVSALNAEERIVVSSFDFAGQVIFTSAHGSPAAAGTPTSTPR